MAHLDHCACYVKCFLSACAVNRPPSANQNAGEGRRFTLFLSFLAITLVAPLRPPCHPASCFALLLCCHIFALAHLKDWCKLAGVLRPLLVAGNEKLSQTVFHFDLPAIRTCPGRSRLCSRVCYATRNRYQYPQVQERLQWALEQSKRKDFVDRMVDELYRKGIILMRWHCSGDVYSPTYARKMLEVIGRSPHTTFWTYSRSWRAKAIFPILKAISLMPNMSLWFSVDSETGYPAEVPDGVRIAFMQVQEDDDAEQADLVFLNHPLRKRVPLNVLDKVCPTETPEGKAKGVTCATCQLCFT
jgi:hypothetical protein